MCNAAAAAAGSQQLQRRIRSVRKLGQAKAWPPAYSEAVELTACGVEINAGSMLSIGFGVAGLRPQLRNPDNVVGDCSNWPSLPRIFATSNGRRGQNTATYQPQQSPRKKMDDETSPPSPPHQAPILTPQPPPPPPLYVSGSNLSRDRHLIAAGTGRSGRYWQKQGRPPRTAAATWKWQGPSPAPPSALSARRLVRTAPSAGGGGGKRALAPVMAEATVGPWRGRTEHLKQRVDSSQEDETVSMLRHLLQALPVCPMAATPRERNSLIMHDSRMPRRHSSGID